VKQTTVYSVQITATCTRPTRGASLLLTTIQHNKEQRENETLKSSQSSSDWYRGIKQIATEEE
jgi:hypothetical protein